MAQLAPDQPRIMGSEMEYGLISYDKYDSLLMDWPGKDTFRLGLPKSYIQRSLFLANGARFYIDVGNHPEYATPECNDLDDLIAHEFAGEAIAYQTFSQIAAKDNTPVERFRLNKSVVDDNDNYWGYHENYQSAGIEQKAFRENVVPLLAIHIATRGSLFGAGHAGVQYQTTQKGLAVRTLTDGAANSIDSRPLIDSNRSEPHADGEEWRRIHITSGDPNMLPWPTWMKFGTTSVVLRMIEAGVNLDDLRLAQPVEAVHTVSRDTDLKANLSLKNGRNTTALEIQTELAKRAAKFAESHPLSDQEMDVIQEWQAACADLQQDSDLCYGRVEWVTKQTVLAAFTMRNQISYESPKLNLPINLWTNLDPNQKGGARKLRNSGLLPKMPTAEAIEYAINHAPATRASLRGRVVLALCKANMQGVVNWAKINISNEDYDLPDPSQTENPEIEELIRKILAEAEPALA
ncbi:MAG: proteasome accessory factor PafA2 family protein [Candidatus Saccharimonadales bacterium]